MATNLRNVLEISPILFCIFLYYSEFCRMIFYFSGTGNTKWAAKHVAARLNEQLKFIPDELSTDMTYTVNPGESIGFIIPVHGWRPPLLVRRFLSQCQFIHTDKVYTYIIYTAGDSIGKAVEIFENDLKHHGLTVDAALSLIMPESYVGLPFMDVDKVEKEKAKKLKAAEELEVFVSDVILPKKQDIRKVVKGPVPSFFSGPIGSFFVNRLITDKRFHVDADRCLQCGMCASVCPVNDIEGGKGKMPSWKHNGQCLTCFSCYHHCPTHAIEFGRQTQKKGQYYYDKNK